MTDPTIKTGSQRDRGGGDEGGEPVCWAGRVCPACGRLNAVPITSGRACQTCGTSPE